jgi:TolB-like protein
MGPSFTSRFGGSTTPPDSIRDLIGATHVLSGALRLENGKVRVFAQLIRTSDRRHIWVSRFLDSTETHSQVTIIADSIARATTNIVLRPGL